MTQVDVGTIPNCRSCDAIKYIITHVSALDRPHVLELSRAVAYLIQFSRRTDFAAGGCKKYPAVPAVTRGECTCRLTLT